MIKFGWILICCCLSLTVSAQNTHELGMLPTVNINKKLKKDWSLNFKHETRIGLFQDELESPFVLADFSFAGAKKISVRTKIVGGYMVRFEEGGPAHRSFQQINIVKKYPSFRIAHRIATDQTFEDKGSPEFRLRYRLSSEIPLNGSTLDPKEFFLKVSNEYLNGVQENEYDLEIRGLGFLGYAINEKNKIELGVDYRLDRFLNGGSRNRHWIGFNYYLSF